MGFVVIAEPDEVNAARIKTILDSLDKDFSYALVGSAEAAIQLVEQNTTDVFIADMQMPVIKGTELFSMIEMMSPETIRIVMTDGARIADTVAFMNECRTFKIIIKPCRVADDLMAPIRAAFRYKEQLERAAGQEQEQETAYSMTEQAYLEHRRMWLMRASNNKRAQDVLAELMKVNLSFQIWKQNERNASDAGMSGLYPNTSTAFRAGLASLRPQPRGLRHSAINRNSRNILN